MVMVMIMIVQWAEEKRADAEERRAARRSEGGSVPAGPSAAKKGRSGSPLIITRMAASHMGAAEGRVRMCTRFVKI